MANEMDERQIGSVVAPPTGFTSPRWYFGIHFVPDSIFDPSVGFYNALRVTTVYFGTPAHQHGIEPGDVITRINGIRVETNADYATQLTYSTTGTVSMRVRDCRTGAYLDFLSIVLAPFPTPGPGPGPGPIGP